LWGFNPHNVFSRIEKDDDLIEVIWVNKFVYEKPFKVAWDVWNWRSKSNKGNQEKNMQMICNMIHGQ
jgi:hypothetical protein